MSNDSDYREGVKEESNPKASSAKPRSTSPNAKNSVGPFSVNISASESHSDNTHYNFNATMNEEQVRQKVASDIKCKEQATKATTILKISAAIGIVVAIGGLIAVEWKKVISKLG